MSRKVEEMKIGRAFQTRDGRPASASFLVLVVGGAGACGGAGGDEGVGGQAPGCPGG